MLPEGRRIGRFTGSLVEVQPFIAPLHGAVLVEGEGKDGFILVDRGNYIAAYIRDEGAEFMGDLALDRMKGNIALDFDLRSYTPGEMAAAKSAWMEYRKKVGESVSQTPAVQRRGITPAALAIVQKQPGVVAVAAFEDGFTVLSTGKADFEQVGAIAEDLLRAGISISSDLGISPLAQMILETPKAKLIIAPMGDLNLCVLSEPGANLGLIRIAISRLQSEVY